MKKLDLIGECNDQKLPLEDFRMSFCNRCLQQECTRSQAGLSRFDARVSSWEERLFHAPQLPKQDPRYAAIIAKKFLALPVGSIPGVRLSETSGRTQEWVDPATLDDASLPPQIFAEPPPVPEIKVDFPAAEPEPPRVPETPKVFVTPPLEDQGNDLKPPQNSPNLLGKNTPYGGPMTLANPEGASKPSGKDPWAVPSPRQESGARVVNPGTRIKIGG